MMRFISSFLSGLTEAANDGVALMDETASVTCLPARRRHGQQHGAQENKTNFAEREFFHGVSFIQFN